MATDSDGKSARGSRTAVEGASEMRLAAAERAVKGLLLVSHRAYALALELELLAKSDPGESRDLLRSRVGASVGRLAEATLSAEQMVRVELWGSKVPMGSGVRPGEE